MRFFTIAITSLAACAYAMPQLTGGMRATDTSKQPRDQAQGTDEINIPEHFACTQDSDCVIRNVGNCCGYYPKCANADAELPDPCPGGGMGVCGFPTINSCKCGSRGGCISLQGKTKVHGREFDD